MLPVIPVYVTDIPHLSVYFHLCIYIIYDFFHMSINSGNEIHWFEYYNFECDLKFKQYFQLNKRKLYYDKKYDKSVLHINNKEYWSSLIGTCIDDLSRCEPQSKFTSYEINSVFLLHCATNLRFPYIISTNQAAYFETHILNRL